MRVLGVLRPKMTVAVYPRRRDLVVESGRAPGDEKRRWALVGIPPHDSREHRERAARARRRASSRSWAICSAPASFCSRTREDAVGAELLWTRAVVRFHERSKNRRIPKQSEVSVCPHAAAAQAVSSSGSGVGIRRRDGPLPEHSGSTGKLSMSARALSTSSSQSSQGVSDQLRRAPSSAPRSLAATASRRRGTTPSASSASRSTVDCCRR